LPRTTFGFSSPSPSVPRQPAWLRKRILEVGVEPREVRRRVRERREQPLVAPLVGAVERLHRRCDRGAVVVGRDAVDEFEREEDVMPREFVVPGVVARQEVVPAVLSDGEFVGGGATGDGLVGLAQTGRQRRRTARRHRELHGLPSGEVAVEHAEGTKRSDKQLSPLSAR